MSKPACAGCHNGFQPIGLAFEKYDNLGRYRESYEDGSPIITSGELANAGDAAGPYQNVVELAGRIGNSQIGQFCFSRQYAEYALGRHLHASLDACTLKSVASAATAPRPVRQFAAELSELITGSNRYHQ
jgi:hypothetical protein